MTDNFECNIDATCEENPNCCFRQLKRKKQECEELKKANDGILTTIRILAKNNIKLREILTEIKEIAEIKIECKTYEIEHDCFNKTRCKALNEHIDFIKQILQKIGECEAKNEN